MTIRVLLVDDHPAVRRGLRELLASYSDLQVVGEAGDGAAALQAAASLQPDVIVLDILLPGPDGVDIAQRLRFEVPDAKVVILTAFGNEEYVRGALRAGARAYLLKTTSDQTVVETIRQVHDGRRLLSPELMDDVLRQFETLAQRETLLESGLSDQEFRMLQMIAAGAANEEIRRELYWSERTVKRKIEEICVKLGAKNRTQAAVEALRRGLI
jgi:DNA-binding NarL/FixJ family response regulator